jgi:mannitol/fructose-specific phosphotransferase system IIA component (Ntr-type)
MNVPSLKLHAPPRLGLAATTEQEAIEETVALLQDSREISDAGRFLQAVIDRQKINPPLLGNGVALPHARTPVVREIVCVAARCNEEIPFGPERLPVRLIFLFGVPPDQISQYLALTAGLVRRLRNPDTIAGLLSAETAEAFQQWLES